MPNNKMNTDALGGELKFADSEKPTDETSVKKLSGAEFLKKENKLNEKGRGNVSDIFKKKNKFPLVLDIIIAILAVAIVVGAVFGAYFAFVYFSDDSEEVTVEYIILTAKEDSGIIAKGKDVFIDSDKTYYMGSIVDVNYKVEVEGKANPFNVEIDYMLVKVRATVEYRSDEGYSINGEKIAVGKDITVRTGEYVYSGTLVGLKKVS